MFESFIIGFGCFSLGAVLGGIIVHYIALVKEFTLRGLTSVVAILGGAGVIKVFELMGTSPSELYWMYPVGLLAGAIVVGAVHWNPGETRRRRKPSIGDSASSLDNE